MMQCSHLNQVCFINIFNFLLIFKLNTTVAKLSSLKRHTGSKRPNLCMWSVHFAAIQMLTVRTVLSICTSQWVAKFGSCRSCKGETLLGKIPSGYIEFPVAALQGSHRTEWPYSEQHLSEHLLQSQSAVEFSWYIWLPFHCQCHERLLAPVWKETERQKKKEREREWWMQSLRMSQIEPRDVDEFPSVATVAPKHWPVLFLQCTLFFRHRRLCEWH